jgi:4-hydroxy-tetrahydrodipicolinate synthase
MPDYPFHGVYPVLYAFWRADGRLDHDAMRGQVEHCIAAGAHGIMVLGLVTEVHKMDTAERLEVVETVGAAIAGRVPYAVTVGEPTIPGQIAFSRRARAAGADWVILQPPPVKGVPESELLAFFGAVAEALDFPVAIQNNPVNLDVWLSVASLVELARRSPNITLLKGEGNVVDVARVIEGTDGRLAVFGGHGGLEFPSLLRAGGAGLIPAPDVLALQVRLYALYREGTEASRAEAERLHREILPLIVFMTKSIGTILTYGKRLMAERLGLPEPINRPPSPGVTPFGLAEVGRMMARVRAVERELGIAEVGR